MREPASLRLTDFTNVDMTVTKMGAGGFGLVFMGPDRLHGGTWYALKTLRPELVAMRPDLRDLFLSECLTWVGLWPHPNLLSAVTATQIDGRLYLILNYAEHGSLRDLLTVEQPFSTRLAWAQHTAAGLLALHTPDPEFLRPHPLVHRDLKPENVLVDEIGYARITDFGLAAAIGEALAKMPNVLEAFALVENLAELGTHAIHTTRATRTARFQTRTLGANAIPGSTPTGVHGLGGVGTIAYMPPEQWVEGGEVGMPADLYAFGLILSELLAGRHGLDDLEANLDEDDWYHLHLNGTPRPLRTGLADGATRLPREMEQLYQALLAKHPEDRPTAGEALVALQQAAAHLGEDPYIPSNAYSRTDERRRMKWHNWANTCFEFGRFEEALVRNTYAFALAPQEFKVLCDRGTIIARLGLNARQSRGDGMADESTRILEESLAWYDRALVAATTDTERADSMGMQAARLNELGRYAEAEEAHAITQALYPDNGFNWLNRTRNGIQWARAEVEAGRSAEARRLYTLTVGYAQQAVRFNPNNPDSHRLLAAIQRELAQLDG